MPRELLKQLLGIIKRTKTENCFIENNKPWTEVDDRLTLSFREEKVISGREVRTKLEAKLFHRQAERLTSRDTIMSYFYRPQGKVMFLHLSVCSQGDEWGPPGQRLPWTEFPQKGHGTRQEVTSYTPPHKQCGIRQEVLSYTLWYWHLVAATAAVGMHPTGMHSC